MLNIYTYSFIFSFLRPIFRVCLYVRHAEVLHQCLRGACPVAHGVLGVFAGLGKGLGPSLGNKYRVVPESTVAMRFGGYGAFDDSVKDVLAAVEYKHYDCAEACSAASLGDIAQIVQQQTHIGSRVMPRTGSISSAVHARGAVQRIDFQTGIVSKTIHTISVVNPSSLLSRIALEGIGILGDVVMAAYVIEAADIESIGGYGADFFELVCVIGGKYQCLHNDA